MKHPEPIKSEKVIGLTLAEEICSNFYRRQMGWRQIKDATDKFARVRASLKVSLHKAAKRLTRDVDER